MRTLCRQQPSQVSRNSRPFCWQIKWCPLWCPFACARCSRKCARCSLMRDMLSGMFVKGRRVGRVQGIAGSNPAVPIDLTQCQTASPANGSARRRTPRAGVCFIRARWDSRDSRGSNPRLIVTGAFRVSSSSEPVAHALPPVSATSSHSEPLSQSHPNPAARLAPLRLRQSREESGADSPDAGWL